MAKIEYRLSKKILSDSGKSEIVIQFSHLHYNMRAKSGIFVNPSFFEFNIDWRKTDLSAKESGITIERTKENTTSIAKAAKMGLVLQESGDIVIRQRVETPEVKEHKEYKGVKQTVVYYCKVK